MPNIIDLKVNLEVCYCCKSLMIDSKVFSLLKRIDKTEMDVVPVYEQVIQAKLQKTSNYKNEDEDYLCIKCFKEGKATFQCYLCEKLQSSDKKYKEFGLFPTEYLCIKCFETQPAKKFLTAVKELEESHKYDFS